MSFSGFQGFAGFEVFQCFRVSGFQGFAGFEGFQGLSFLGFEGFAGREDFQGLGIRGSLCGSAGRDARGHVEIARGLTTKIWGFQGLGLGFRSRVSQFQGLQGLGIRESRGARRKGARCLGERKKEWPEKRRAVCEGEAGDVAESVRVMQQRPALVRLFPSPAPRRRRVGRSGGADVEQGVRVAQLPRGAGGRRIGARRGGDADRHWELVAYETADNTKRQ